ncbi:hypothetical protein DE146DRAFT_319481 [Phaeosphaeria sp. MPI-PUGE-AT-0046c]|nr:hypothetical protein DE146DRAFT_319481 [Phaeosphaeria sp. MPI-PUGE-AT-0046c]
MVSGLSTRSDSSAGAMEVDNGHLAEFDLFGLYEAMHVPLPEVRISDNSDNEPTEPAPPDLFDATVPQPFRRWMRTLRSSHYSDTRRSMDRLDMNHAREGAIHLR